MSKTLSPYIVKHILKFIKNHDHPLLCRINKQFKNVINSDINYKYQLIKQNWLASVNRNVLNKYRDKLDIVERKNGDHVFFIIDFDEEFTDYRLIRRITDNSSRFVAAGDKFEWDFDFDAKQFILNSDSIDMINDADDMVIVKPFRLFRDMNVTVYAIYLYYYEYLEMEVVEKEDRDQYQNHYYTYEIKKQRMIYDFQNYFVKNHADLIKERPLSIANIFVNDSYYKLIGGKCFMELRDEDTVDYSGQWTDHNLEIKMDEWIYKQQYGSDGENGENEKEED